MSRIHVVAERTMAASPADVYASLTDYQRKHQQILPPEHFRDFTVEQGGRGDGTVVSFKLKAGGRERPFRMRVSELERGRILQEIDTGSSTVTTFHVEPVGEAGRAACASSPNGKAPKASAVSSSAPSRLARRAASLTPSLARWGREAAGKKT